MRILRTFWIAVLLVVGCNGGGLVNLDLKLHHESGITLNGSRLEGEKEGTYYELFWGQVSPPPTSIPPIRIRVGNKELSLSNVTRSELEEAGLAQLNLEENREHWTALYENAGVHVYVSNEGKLLHISLKFIDALGSEPIAKRITFKYAGGDWTELPMNEDQVRAYFGPNYTKDVRLDAS